MNLGVVWSETCSEFEMPALLLAVLIPLLLRLFLKIRKRWLIALFCLIYLLFFNIGIGLFHREMFVERHQAQNTLVPQAGCISYNPLPATLLASYSMSLAEYENWVKNHEWPLEPYDMSLLNYDSEQLGFDNPSVAYATPETVSGKQLRTYFCDGVMHLYYAAF